MKKCKYLKTLTLLLFSLFVNELKGQWYEVNIDNNTNFVSMDFLTPAEGIVVSENYINANQFNSIYYYTNDSGAHWEIVDTSINFFCNEFEFKYDWGVSCGKVGLNARICYFDKINHLAKSIDFIEFKEITQIEIVDSANAVFLAMDSLSNSYIGLLTLKSGSILIENKINLGIEKVKKIRFFNKEFGYYLISRNLIKIENNFLSQKLIAKNVNHFDFYKTNLGVIQSDSIASYTTNGGIDWIIYESGGIADCDDLIMNSDSTLIKYYDWGGTSGGTYLSYINIYKGYYGFDELETGRIPYVRIKCFNSKVIYVASSRTGSLFKTFNNGNHNRINQLNFNSDKVQVFPNPADNLITIKFDELLVNKITYYVSDIDGKIIVSKSLIKNKDGDRLNIDRLKSGLYFLNINYNNTIYIKKIIKK